MQNTYLAKRARLENYFNEVSSDAWDKLTSNEPVSFVRQLVREGREKMQLAIMEKLPKDLTGLRVLDAGCGTGLVGAELKKHGFTNFFGADLSQKLLDLVPNNLYKKLDKVDLNKPIKEKDDQYDALMCVGTFTFGHVKPPALDEFIRITKNKSLICFTINEGIYEEYGFDKKIKQLKNENKWKEIEFFKSDYIASKDVNAWLGLYEVTK